MQCIRGITHYALYNLRTYLFTYGTYLNVLGAETPASGTTKSKDTTTPVKESMALPSEESRQKIGTATDSGKTTATRMMKTESKIKHEPMESPEVTAGKPAAAAPASQVSFSSDVIICERVKGPVWLLMETHLTAMSLAVWDHTVLSATRHK